MNEVSASVCRVWARLPGGVSSLVGRETSLGKDTTPRLCAYVCCVPNWSASVQQGFQAVRGVAGEDFPGKGGQVQPRRPQYCGTR